jgi:predicted P-loop ATPase
MRDHEIDLVDAEQDDKKGVEEPEIRGELRDISKNKVLRYPDQASKGDQAIKDPLPGPPQTPDLELPQDEEGLGQRIDIVRDRVAVMSDLDQVKIDILYEHG